MRSIEKILLKSDLLSANISIQKKELRKILLKEREIIAQNTAKSDWGPAQFTRTLKLLNVKDAHELSNKYLIGCYFPFRSELNLIDEVTSKWLFPKVMPDRKMLWFEYGDGVTGYHTNHLGLKERLLEHCFEYTNKMPKMLCFVPALAVSKDGYRLGYGGGFYDVFLSELKEHVISIACVPSQQFVFDTLPYDSLDQKVDKIVF